MMNQKIIRKLSTGLFFISMLFYNSGCDSLTPSDFKSGESSAPAIDHAAADILARDIFYTNGTINDSLCWYVRTRPMFSDTLPRFNIVDSASRANSTDNQLINARYNALLDSLSKNTILRDTICGVLMAPHEDVAYARFDVASNESHDIYIYTSLRYTAQNIDHYVSIQLINIDSSAVSYDDIILPESRFVRTEVVQVSGGERIVPVIRSRYKVHVNTGNYIVRCTSSERTIIRSFKLLIKSR
jgi:hypothetical protein